MAKPRPLLTTTGTVLDQLKFIRTKKQEYFVCLSLDSGLRLIARRVVSMGTLTAAIVHPREVFAGPLKDRAAAVIVAHNHPSGDAQPSKSDIETTQQLVAAGMILGVRLHDHFVIAKNGHYSFKDHLLI